MNLHKSKIDWCTHTWNPVTGCKHGCEYCYARAFTERFKPHYCETLEIEPVECPQMGNGIFVSDAPARLHDETGAYVRSTPYPKGFSPTLHTYTMDYPEKRLIPSRVFVSSMGDLFGSWVPDAWIEEVFASCKRAPQHTYLFLTKNPERYMQLARAGKLPEEDNFWYGSTATTPDASFWWSEYHHTFVSIEPMLAPFETGGPDEIRKVEWVIIGAMTGTGSKKHQPKREWVEAIVQSAENTGTPVFMKENLAGVWGPDLIREHPEGMVWPEEG